MAITYGFFNAEKQSDGSYDRTYSADQMSTYFEGLISDGVYENVGTGMQVVADSGMQVQVGPGRAIINSKWIKNTTSYPLTIKGAHATLNRYTAVILKLDMSERAITITTKDGENADSPSKPSMTVSATTKELCLAYVYIGAGVTSISQSNITDTRPSGLCGWVTGIVKQVDTSKLFLQWQTAYEEFYEERTKAYDEWFSALTEELNVNTYIEKYRKVVDITSLKDSFALDMSGYVYGSRDVLLVSINGIALVEGTDYTIDTSKDPVEINMNNTLDSNNTLEIIILKSKIGQG